MTKDSKALSWLEFFYGLCLVAFDMFFQKLRCRHLPKRLPLKPLPHLTVIVTGATSGIGVEIAGELARAGVHVVLAVRNTAAGKKLVQEWVTDQVRKGGPGINAEVMELDLLSLASVRAFAKEWNDRKVPLHVLINNAGIFSMFVRQKFSEDGYEHHMQVNHLGHALLTMLLLPSLIRGAPSRIINVNSDMHHLGYVHPEDMNLTKRKFSSLAGYCGSKLAQILFSRILQMRIPKDAGVDVIIVHPGEVMTSVTRDLPAAIRQVEQITKVIRFSPLEGSRSVLYVATDNKVFQYTRALRDMGVPIAPYFTPSCRPSKVHRLADDVEHMEKVYSKTLELVGLPEDYLDGVLGNKTFSNPVDEVKDDQI
ncbi:unnamed protein product [Calypogeia fissa]